MADLATASLNPLSVTIDGKKFVVEKLTMADIAGISQGMVQGWKEAILKDKSLKDEERINKANSLKAPGVFQVMDHLLDSPEGSILALFIALKKKQPDITYDWVAGLVLSDELTQLVFDVLGVKRQVATDKKKISEESSK